MTTAASLLSSKKFVMAILSVIAFIAAKKGFDFDTAAAFTAISPMLAAIVGQGIADHGKSAAEINAASAAASSASATAALTAMVAPSSKPSPAIAPVAMLAVLLVALVALGTSACGPKSAAFAKGVWDCTQPQRAELVGQLEPALESIIVTSTSADGKSIDPAPLKAVTSKANLETEAGVVATCAISSAFAALLTPAPAKPGAPASSALAIDPGALHAAFDAMRADQFAGAHFQTAHGGI